MDSRIREIEQWVAEAREGLSDGGREVYLRKLYLLEAEIRAVIKENGMLPQGTSPVPAEKRVRRSASPAWNFNLSAAAAGVLVLAATTFYFASSGSGPTSNFTVPPRLADASMTTDTESYPPTRNRLAAEMAVLGEELLPDSWTPPQTESSLLAAAPASEKSSESFTPETTAKQQSNTPAGHPGVILASTQTPGAKPSGPGLPGKPAGKLARGTAADGDDATDVVIMASAGPQEQSVNKQASKVGKGSGSRPSAGFDLPTVSYNFFPEGMAPPVKTLKSRVKSKMNDLAHDPDASKKGDAVVHIDSDAGDDDDTGDKAEASDKTAAAGDEAGTEGGQSGEKSDS